MKKSEEWFMEKREMEEHSGGTTAAPEADTLVQEVHTDRQETVDPPTTKKEEIDQAFELIEDMIERGYRFSDEQMDTMSLA